MQRPPDGNPNVVLVAGAAAATRITMSEHDQHNGHDHTEHHRMMIRDFRTRFFVTVVLAVPVLALAPIIQGFLGYSFSFPGSRYVVFGLASVIFFYGGWPFLTGLKDELADRPVSKEAGDSLIGDCFSPRKWAPSSCRSQPLSWLSMRGCFGSRRRSCGRC